MQPALIAPIIASLQRKNRSCKLAVMSPADTGPQTHMQDRRRARPQFSACRPRPYLQLAAHERKEHI